MWLYLTDGLILEIFFRIIRGHDMEEFPQKEALNFASSNKAAWAKWPRW